jgi:hypothetical protein
MEFYCGLTDEERDKRDSEWHDFFALFPRTIQVRNGYFICACLQTIQRRAVGIVYWDGRYVEWEYRRKETA